METSKELAERLGNVRHFMKLTMADRLSIIVAGQMHLFSPGTMIFAEGEPCAGMFVLLKGHVHICKHGPQGQINIIDDIEPVIMFNEVALLDGGPNPYTAIAVQNCFVWQISPAAYQKLLKRFARDTYMEVALGLLGIMASRYRQLLDNYGDISFLTVPIRVAKFLYEASDQGQKPIIRREVSINEMAAHIACAPEAISRSINMLTCQDIIKATRTAITVLKAEELAKLAQVESRTIFHYN